MKFQSLINETIQLIDQENRVIRNIEQDDNYFRAMPSGKALMISHHKQNVINLIDSVKFMQRCVKFLDKMVAKEQAEKLEEFMKLYPPPTQ